MSENFQKFFAWLTGLSVYTFLNNHPELFRLIVGGVAAFVTGGLSFLGNYVAKKVTGLIQRKWNR
jgi:hypothetical protein